MGTLSGWCSFGTLDFSFKPRQILIPRHTNRPKNICLLCCGGTSFRKKTERRIQIVSFRNFCRNFRCYSTSNGNNGNGDRESTSTASSNDSNANTTTSTTTTTTTTAEPHGEAEERPRNEFESDKRTPPSVSSRVLLRAFLYMYNICVRVCIIEILRKF